ncbi:MAG: NERD domain-containing protein [Clostridia bacterium]|nr:NERD domain-containing protein [Clostridia bacterium]
MELFKKFNETIFYKNDSELEKQVTVLQKLNKEYPNNDIIANKLKLCEIGLKGEKEIEFELKNANIGMYVLHDINLEYEELKAQIDYIVITPAYVYFIECKNLIGNITINNRGEFIRDYTLNGNKIREGIYSSLRQAERHIEVFKKIWNQRNTSIIDKLFRSQNLDNWYRPLVVMANSKNILNTKYAPKDVKNKVIKSDLLVDYIKKDIKKLDKDYLNNQKIMENMAQILCQSYHKPINKDYEQEFRKYVKNNIKEENVDIGALRDKLIAFRKEKSQNKNIPIYYIFTDEELEKILNEMPKKIDDLKKSNILTEVKIKFHGDEIINIINSYAK